MKNDNHAAGYDFVQLGEGLSRSLLAAAEEQVSHANTMLDQTKALVQILQNQVIAQAKQIEEMNGRFKAFGETMLDAHRKLNGGEPPPREPSEKGRLFKLHEREQELQGMLPRVKSMD